MADFVLALVLPFVALFLLRRPVAGVGALLLQATILGWPIASVWALAAQRSAEETRDA